MSYNILTMIIPILYLVTLPLTFALQSQIYNELNDECRAEVEDWVIDFENNPQGPMVPCEFLTAEWIECEDIAQQSRDNSTKDGTFCPYFGEKNGVVPRVNISCRVLPCIECLGDRQFLREVPCIKYTGHYFLSALLYSIFLGMVAADRFYMGYSAIAVGKLMTLGGLGIWWIADIFLLVHGSLKPSDDSEWQPWRPY